MRAMKDSGIYDGVEIPVSWDTMKFGKVCSVVTDFVASGSFADLRENVPYLSEPDYAMLVRTTDLAKTARSEGKVYISKASYEFLSNSNLFGGEIVLPNIGSIGDVYVVPKLYDRMSLAPNSIMFKTNYCDKYYYYYFLSKVGGLQLSEISQSTAMAKFNKTDLKQIRVFLPSLAEQQRIAEFLDRKCAEVDEIIALQEQIIEELKAYKQSVITEAVTKGLNPAAPMRDSGIEWIGSIPEHWEVKRLKNVADLNPTFNAQIEQDTLVAYMPMECLRNGIIQERIASYSEVASYTPFKDGDVVMAKVTPCFENGNIAVANNLQGGYGFGTSEIFVIRCGKEAHNKYVFYYLQSAYIKNLGVSSMTGTGGLKRVNPTILNNSYFISPSVAEQQAIADYLDEKCADIDSLIQTKQQKIDSLKGYKKSIIYEYVTGKREVNE